MKMENIHIKTNFAGYSHLVTPLQHVFQQEDCEADLNTDVLEFLSVLQNELVGEMMKGACAISQHRGSDEVTSEDLLFYLDTQWNIDPLLLHNDQCTKNYYMTKIADEIKDLPKPPPRKKIRRSRNLPKKHPTTSMVKKKSTGKSKLKSKSGQLKIKPSCKQGSKAKVKKNQKSKAKTESKEVHHEHLFKISLPQFICKKPEPELKAERQLSMEMSFTDSLVEFLRNKCKQHICNVDGIPEASPVTSMCKPESKPEEEMSVCKRPMDQICLDPVINAFNRAGGKEVSVPFTVHKQSPEALISKAKSQVGEMSNCESSIKISPCKENTKLEFEVPVWFCLDPETCTFRIAGLRQDLSVAGDEQPYCESSIQIPPSKVTSDPEILTGIHSDPEALTIRITEVKLENFKREACTCKPKSNVEKEMSPCKCSK